MLETPMNAEESAEADMPEGSEREICVHVLPDGSLDVDGEPSPDLGAALKLVMAKVKQMQAEAGGEGEAMSAGFEGVRGGAE